MSNLANLFILHLCSLPAGAPTGIAKLVELFDVHRDTARKAVVELEALGYVERVQYRSTTNGTFERVKWRISYYAGYFSDGGPGYTGPSPDDNSTAAEIIGSGDDKTGSGVESLGAATEKLAPVPVFSAPDFSLIESPANQAIAPLNQALIMDGLPATPQDSPLSLLYTSNTLPASTKKNKERGSAEGDSDSRKPKRREFTALGRRFAEVYIPWARNEGQPMTLSGLGNQQISYFNSMAEKFTLRYNQEGQRSEDYCAKAYKRILERSEELDGYKAGACIDLPRFNKCFVEIMKVMDRKPGTKTAPPAITAPDQYTPTQRNYYLNYLNMWRRKFGLPKVESFDERDVKLCEEIAHAATHSQHPPHPQATHYAKEWQQLNQPVNA